MNTSQMKSEEIRKVEGDARGLLELVEARKRELVVELTRYSDLSVRVLVDRVNVGRDLDASEARLKDLRRGLDLAQAALTKIEGNLLELREQDEGAKYEDALERLPDLVVAGRVANREYADLVLQLSVQAQEIYRLTNELKSLGQVVERYTQQHPGLQGYGVRIPTKPFPVTPQMVDRASMHSGPDWVRVLLRDRPSLAGED